MNAFIDTIDKATSELEKLQKLVQVAYLDSQTNENKVRILTHESENPKEYIKAIYGNLCEAAAFLITLPNPFLSQDLLHFLTLLKFVLW